MSARCTYLVLALTLAAGVAADDFRAVVVRAEELAARNNTAAAVSVLNAGLARCLTETDRECRAHLQFALGYVQDGAGEHASAADAYKAVLAEFPGNAQALANLARIQRRSGDIVDAAAAYEQAAASDAANRATYLVSAAEVFQESDRYADAMRLYQQAIDAGSDDAAPRLVAMMERWVSEAATNPERVSRLQKTMEVADRLRREGTNGAAVEAYETVIAQHATAPALAERALTVWTETRANSQSLTQAALERLPSTEQWSSLFLRDLVATFTEGAWRFTSESMTNELARYAAAAAGKAAGDQLVAANRLDEAGKLYLSAFRRAPEMPLQDSIPELSWRPGVQLDIALQLARVAQASNNKALFTSVEGQLFNEKMQYYQSRNLAAIQRMHTVLGTIYAERGEWQVKPGSMYTNATFQLAAALRTAETRQKEQPTLQPLPHIRTLLAEGYRKQNNVARAREQEIAAARDFLDLDAVDAAQESLARAAAASPTAQEKTSIGALQTIATFRSGVATLQSVSGADDVWKYTVATVTLDADFVARQNFKTLTDLASRAEKLGQKEQAEALYIQAIDAGTGQKLAPRTDTLRVYRIQLAVEEKPKEQPYRAVELRLGGTRDVRIDQIKVSPSIRKRHAKPAAASQRPVTPP